MQSLTRRVTAKHEQTLLTTDDYDKKTISLSDTKFRTLIVLSVIIIISIIIFLLFSGSNAESAELITKNSNQDEPTVKLTVPTVSAVHKLTIHSLYKVQPLEGNEQSERKNMVIEPGRFQEYDPFLLLFEDWIGPKNGFDDHPHRGMETVTLVLEGQIEHADNRGNKGVLSSGDVQWMTSGSGIIHREMPHGQGGHTLQLWLNIPPKNKMTPARYQDIPASKQPKIEQKGVLVKLISGEQKGMKSPTKNIVPVLAMEGFVETGHTFDVDIPAGYRSFIYVIQGRGNFGRSKQQVSSGNVIWIAPSTRNGTFEIESKNAIHFFMASGPPIKTPVFAQGPFVMSSQDEIYKAYQDYQMGKFGGPVLK